MKMEVFNELNKEQQDREHKALMRLRATRMDIKDTLGRPDPFYEAILLPLDLVPDWTCKSIAVTNKNSIIFNPLFIMGMTSKERQEIVKKLLQSETTEQERAEYLGFIDCFYKEKNLDELRFLLEHEAEHIVREFMSRLRELIGGQYTPEQEQKLLLLNIAQDHVINLARLIQTQGLSGCSKEELPRRLPEAIRSYEAKRPCTKYIFKDTKYIWSTTEEIYEDLLEESNKQQSKGSGGLEGGSGLGGGSGSGLGRAAGDQSQNNKYVIDEHFEGTPEEVEAFREMCANGVMRAIKIAGRDKVSPEVLKLYDSLDKPTIKWSQLLDREVKSSVIRDFTYAELHNKTRYMTQWCRKQGYISDKQYLTFPTEEPEKKVKVIIGFDTSGSISLEEKRLALSEAVGILKQFKDYELIVFSWGSCVVEESFRTYTPQNHKEIVDYPFMAGGGTLIGPTLELFTKYKEHQAVVFTDGYFADKVDSKLKRSLKGLIFVVYDNDGFTSDVGRIVHKRTKRGML